MNYRHWTLENHNNNYISACLSHADSSVNKLSREVFEELEQVLEEASSNSPQGLIFYSGKEDHTIVGADIDEFDQNLPVVEIEDLCRKGNELFCRLSEQKFPTLALINGNCLGGGLEFALSCNFRLA